jgi:tripartite-type tricarboxylate transporter receptor subunit TctC
MKKMRMILGIIFAAMLLMVVTISSPALSQEKFPSRPIKMIVPYSPGSGTDSSARNLQPEVEKVLGQPIIIINKPGAAGAVGYTECAEARPDGYTVTFTGPTLPMLRHTSPMSKVDIKMLDPIILVAELPLVLAVRQDSPWKNLKEFIDYAKNNPGKIRFSNNGVGGIFHMSALSFEAKAGIKLTHLPFKSNADALMALLGNHLEAGMSSPPTLFQFVKTGKIRILAVSSKERYVYLPDILTFKEFGVDFEPTTFYGFSATKGAPKENIKLLHNAFKKAMDSKRFKEYAEREGMMVTYLGSDEYGEYLEKLDKVWSKVIEDGLYKPVQ